MSESIDISRIVVAQQVLDLIPAQLARRFEILPLRRENDVLWLVCSDPDNLAAVRQVENITGLTLQLLTPQHVAALRQAIRRFYPENLGGDNAAGLLQRIVNRALQLRASDIHLAPDADGGLIQLRIDGRLVPDMRLSSESCQELISVIKIQSRLDIAEKRTPLDGGMSLALPGETVDMRVATIPTIHGEHVTMRLLSQDNLDHLEALDKLGFSPVHYRLLLEALAEPNGIILLSGPTGSGKTTTLYAALRYLRQSGARHLVSVEDPVEKPLEGVTQVKIDADNERVTFNKALRSILRHDPDVIMIGEIRDGETGDIAVKAALTGHLVLSTLHTNSAAGVLTRLVNLGLAPFLVASTMRLAIAQRLVRRPCPYCVSYRTPTAEECRTFGWHQDEDIRVPVANGCSYCGGRGYSGRCAIYEIIPVDREIRHLIMQQADDRALAEHAYNQLKLPSMRGDGADKIRRGMTTVEEVGMACGGI
ncbi:MAG: GspE/PulE family protein [Victivallales bacterium]|nr:GspE/PulE family protein [Victivallales bacterium]